MTDERRVRIMHVITRLVRGGAQRVVLDLLRGLPSTFEPLLVSGEQTGSEGSLWGEAERLEVPIRRVPELVREVSPWKDWQAFRTLRRIIREYRPQIVHAHTSKAGFLGCAAARREAVGCVILAPHGHILGPGAQIPGIPRGGWRRRLIIHAARRSSRYADLVIAPNEVERVDGVRLGMWAPDRSRTVPNGIDTQRFAPRDRREARIRLGWEPDRRRVGVIARLTREKGVDLAIRALARIRGTDLVVVGDGPERASLVALAGSVGVSKRTLFLGSSAHIHAILPAFDLCLVPSRTEAHGMVAAEALASAVPVVAARVGGLPSLVEHERTGLLVEPGDVIDLARASTRLLTNEALARQLAAAGRRHIVEGYSRAAMLGELLDIYRRFVKLRPR